LIRDNVGAANGAKRAVVLTPRIDGHDGISELTRQVVHSLASMYGKDRVEVWALAGAGPIDIAPASFWSATGKRLRFVHRTMATAARSSINLDVFVLHVHLAPLAEVLRCRGARIVTFLIGIEVWKPLRSRERVSVRHAHRLIAISEFTATNFRRANPSLADCPLTVCLPGISSTEQVTCSDTDPDLSLIVGRLSSAERYKGHERLIDIWPDVRTSVPNARLLVVGDGDDRLRLETLARSRSLVDAVIFAGRVSDDELRRLYNKAAMFIMPSTGEGFGFVYLEAMRAAKPCVAVHGAADEIIREGTDGFIVEPGADAALAAAIVRLYSDAHLRETMGKNGRAHVEACFSPTSFDQRFRRAVEATESPSQSAWSATA
jgi:phosphatidylinositol alpha-1,6-mannosyltransferase